MGTVRATVEELRRSFPNSSFTPRALVSVGQTAEDAKNLSDASYFLRTAVSSAPGSAEVAQAQFDLGWLAHEAKNYQESSRLLTEHLAYYVDKNNDNRGAGWILGARDSERAGKLPEARALYQAMLGRYDATTGRVSRGNSGWRSSIAQAILVENISGRFGGGARGC